MMRRSPQINLRIQNEELILEIPRFEIAVRGRTREESIAMLATLIHALRAAAEGVDLKVWSDSFEGPPAGI